MSPRLRQRVALLLAAIMALLPLQAVHAVWPDQPVAGHCQHAESAKHMSTPGKASPCCAMHDDGNDPAANNSHPCNGGCDQCGSSGGAAAVFAIPTGALPILRDTHVVMVAHAQPTRLNTPLFRPPRAFL